ncbi:AMP-binding protein [Rhodococcoides yunnanense]|uniref:AMP-binding protein n=1 Tax=Rhodococcoides yunnanense TaxID=278209 RepID=UPI00093477F6|nr:AMP-binding protein [Rhodococcus yunnanensis]
MDTESDTSPAALRSAAQRFGGLGAVADEDIRWTYRDLHSHVVAVTRALIARNVEPGDRVAIWAPNSHRRVAAALAVHYAGAAIVQIDTRCTGADAADILTQSRAVALCVAGEFLGADRFAELKVAGLPVSLLTVVRLGGPVPRNDTAVPWADLRFLGAAVGEDIAEQRADGVSGDGIADIRFTPQTPDPSSGESSTHRDIAGIARAWAGATSNSDDRCLIVDPFSRTAEHQAGILVALSTGATMVPQVGNDAEAAMDSIERERITVVPGAPSLFSTILDHPSRPNYDLSSWRVALTAAAGFPNALAERMRTELDVVLT